MMLTIKSGSMSLEVAIPETAGWPTVIENVVNGLRAFGYVLPPTSDLLGAMDGVHDQHVEDAQYERMARIIKPT